MENLTSERRISKNVFLMGLTSFFTDVSSEMIYPLLHAFIAIILTAQKALLGPIIGIIEGIAESMASLLKVFVGYYSDKIQKRKSLTIWGYSLSSISKLLLFLVSLGWYFVLFSRFFDRVGKGIRTAPRDALISESTPKGQEGKAFGLHRTMDFAGAFLGVLFCYLVSLEYIDPLTNNLKDIDAFFYLFALSVVPAFIGIGILFFVKEKGTEVKLNKPKPNLNFRSYDKNLQWFFIVTLIFTLGNSSNQFLLLRSVDLGHALSSVIIMYMIFNLSTSLFSAYFGSLSDKIGRKKILITGYLIYATVYASFGFIPEASNWLLWGFWVIYGFYYAMTEGVEKAFVSGFAARENKATALGFFHTIVGICLLPASLIAGYLFSIHPSIPFIFGGSTSLAAVVILIVFVRE